MSGFEQAAGDGSVRAPSSELSGGAVLRAARPAALSAITRPYAPPRGARVVAAVSGGGDSLALGLLLWALAPGRGWDVAWGTVDHGLRGTRGAQDAAFVRGLAARIGVPCEVRAVAVERAPRRSPEDAARTARRAALVEIAAAAGAEAIALGHTLDDQAETVLLRLARGTGTAGLGAMRRHAPPFWRPLLDVERDELRRLLRDLGQGWREDETNAEGRAFRNRVRNEILPLMKTRLGAGVVRCLARAALTAAEDEDFLAASARAAPGIVVAETVDSAELDVAALAALPRALSRRCVRGCCEKLSSGYKLLSAAQVRAIEELVRGRAERRLDLGGGMTARRTKNRLLLEQRLDTEDGR
ncbi:MAG: tRNA lysidine(34) synthetase TilS [Candidatus Polarisedimenticolia bacterium]